MPTSQKTVLIVDDDPLFVDLTAQALRLAFPELTILSIENGGEALVVIHDRGVNLVITDLCMPEVDGLDVLLKLKEKSPSVPSIVVSGYGSTRFGDLARDFGIRLFLEKPFDFNALREGVQRILESEPEAPATGCDVVNFLRLMDIYQKTGTLQIVENGNRGEIGFESGSLTHASTNNQSGSLALFEMLGWSSPEVRISKLVCSGPPNISETLSSLYPGVSLLGADMGKRANS